MKAIDRRMANIERAAGVGKAGPTIFLQWFCSPVTGAVAGGLTFDREPDETMEQFKSRLCREAPWSDGGRFRVIKFTGELGD